MENFNLKKKNKRFAARKSKNFEGENFEFIILAYSLDPQEFITEILLRDTK